MVSKRLLGPPISVTPKAKNAAITLQTRKIPAIRAPSSMYVGIEWGSVSMVTRSSWDTTQPAMKGVPMGIPTILPYPMA